MTGTFLKENKSPDYFLELLFSSLSDANEGGQSVSISPCHTSWHIYLF